MTRRQIGLLAAAGFAIASPIVQALWNIGLSPAEFARPGAETLRAAGYAFSIWGVIYAGIAALAVYQALPRQRDDALLSVIAGPAAVAMAGTGLWIWASALDARWASVAIIVAAAATLSLGLLRAPAPRTLAERTFVWWPLSLLAGWLTLASALNILTVLTMEGRLDGVQRAAAFTGIVAVLIVALFILRKLPVAAYGVPFAWGLVAVWAAEKAAKSDVAALAMGAAVIVGSYVAWRSRPAASGARPGG